MILITGASGTVGSAVAEAVRKTAQPFRAMYRTAADAAKAPAGVTTVIADFSSRDSLNAALAGVDSVFLVCSPIPSLVELESNFIDACVAATGVKHLVLNSALGAADYPKSFPSWHRRVEGKLKTSGLPHTILRPNSFMQNLLAFQAPGIRAQGAFYTAMADASVSYLDVRDVGAAAQIVLTTPGNVHLGQTYELNGPEAITHSALAQRIARFANRAVKYVDLPESAQRESMLAVGMPEWQVTALLELQQYYTNGQGGEVTEVLPKLLGRYPITLDQFLEEYQDQFRTQAVGA